MITFGPSGDSLEILCPSCHATNRVPVRRIAEHPRCGRCRTSLPLDQPVEVDERSFDGLLKQSTLPVLVDFWAPWCGPCRMMAPELEQVAQQKRGEIVVAKLNSEQQPQIAARYGIRAIPTLVLFRQGREVKRLQGAMRAAQVLAELG